MKLRRLFFPLLCVLLLFLAWRNQAQAREFFHVLQRAHFIPLLLAVLFQAGTLFNQPALFQSLYSLVGIDAEWRELAPAVLAGRFVNIVAPAAGLGETALLFEQAKRRGWDLGQVTLVTTLYFVLNFAVFVLILVAGFALLGARGDLKKFEIFAAIPLFFGLTVGIAALIGIALKPEAFERFIEKLIAYLPRKLREKFASETIIGETTRSFSFSLYALNSARSKLIRPAVHAVLVDALEIAVLGMCLWAFGVPINPSILIAGYAIGTLFTIVSFSPQGLGAVEGALGATFVSLGVSLPQATAVVVAYRGLSFWLPLGVGFLATRFWSKKLAANETRPTASNNCSFSTGIVRQ